MLSQHNHSEPHPDNLAPEDVEFIVKRYAKDRDVPGWDEKTGAGLLDAGACLQKIQQPVYTVWHSQQNPINVSDSLIHTSQQIILSEAINGVQPGYYWADVYYITNTYQHTVNSPVQILDGWPRHSSTNGYKNGSGHFPMDTVFMEGFELDIAGNTATVELSTYALHVTQTFNGGVPVNKWIPDSLPLIRLPFSLHLYDSTLVSIEEVNELENDFNVYPNPSEDNATIEAHFSKNEDISISLISVLGQEIKELYRGHSGIGQLSLPVSGNGLPNGIYFVMMTLPDRTLSQKFILNR